MARKKDNPLVSSQPTACECGGKVVWKNPRLSLCLKCYEEQIRPKILAIAADIAFQKRFREVNGWIEKHHEFKTKREACMAALKARGLANLLPEALHELSGTVVAGNNRQRQVGS